MRRIGLTGGIAAGKSAVAARFAQLGALVIDADRIARQVVEPGEPALAVIREVFGPGILCTDGTLDRPALGAMVFSDAEARRRLEAITHPAIARRSEELAAAAAAENPDVVIVQDIPLLAEVGVGRYALDAIVVVEADAETRVRRMVQLRGMSEAAARARIAAQATDAERRAIADHLIDANGTLDETIAQVDALWPRLRPQQD